MASAKFSRVLLLAVQAMGALSLPITEVDIRHSWTKDGKAGFPEKEHFKHHVLYTFTEKTIPNGLYANDQGATPESVTVRDGFLWLTVPGGNRPKFKSEVVTSAKNILYGSVRTVAILSETPGVCNGFFFYKSDSQESDIEWLSDRKGEANAGSHHIWLTNQENSGDKKPTVFKADPPSRPTSTEHEYRLDWTKGRVEWFIDGQLVGETTRDVPSQPGAWVWNNWYNGDKSWSGGPPNQAATLRIRSIEMYYNTA